jgi:hypothetical protein
VVSEEDIVPERAAGYRLVKGELKNQEWVSPSLNTTADGAYYVSLLDFLAWDAAVRKGALLAPASWKAIFTPVALRSGKTYPYGFGWAVDDFSGQRRHHHSGGWQGFATYYSRYLEDDLAVIVLGNSASMNPRGLAEGIAALVNPRLATPRDPIPDREPAVTERLRRLLAAAGEGKLSPEELAYVRAGFFPGAASAYESRLRGAGKLVHLDLIETRVLGDDRAYRYRASYEKGTFDVALGLAPDGKVSAFGIWPAEPSP